MYGRYRLFDGEMFAFAGLWDGWKDPSGEWIKSSSILTTRPNAVTSQIHERMPVILSGDDYDFWLDLRMTDAEAVSDLLKPVDARLLRMFPVSSRVNRVQNDDAECAKPIEVEPPPDQRLFRIDLVGFTPNIFHRRNH